MGYVRHKPGDGRWAIRKGAKARRVEKAGVRSKSKPMLNLKSAKFDGWQACKLAVIL